MPGPNELPLRPGLPDVMTTDDGRKVTTRAMWQKRREEMTRTVAYYQTGLMPPPPGKVKGNQIKSALVLGGTVRYRLVHLAFGPGSRYGYDVAIFVPANAKGRLPTIVFPTFGPTPGATPLPLQVRPPEQGRGLDALTVPVGDQAARVAVAAVERPPSSRAAPPAAPPADPEAAAWTHQDVFRRGYALVMYHYEDTGEDTIGREPDGSWSFRKTRYYPAYPDYDWGLTAGWAWGLSRCLDYLETQSFADHRKFIAVGHSRLGKAVLVAGAFDERIALSAPAGSGAGGTGAYRFNGERGGGREGLADMARKYPNWFSPRLRDFGADVDKLPYDQHWLIALTAPRAFISLEGADDQNCVANAVKQAVAGAAPAYALLGVPARLGVNYASHRHALAPDDWAALLDFADQQLLGKRVARRFDAFPPDLPDKRPMTINVRETGATGNGATKDTAAFQKALDQVAAAGGGEVVVPAGTYLIGSIALGSFTTLRFEVGATLLGSPDLADYPITRVRWEGRWIDGHRALISAQGANHVTVAGPGRVIGSPALGGRQMPRRPAVVEPISCRDVCLEGFYVEQSRMWTVHLTYCENVSAVRLTIRASGGNGDGIDVDSCRHVRIDGCDIDAGDDAIAIKSGRGMEGYRLARATEDVSISNCVLGDANFAGIGIGSETSGGISDVRIDRCVFTHAKTYAIYVKTRTDRGAYIENVSASHITVANAAGFLRFNLTSSGLKDPEPVPGLEGIPATRNFRFSDIVVHGGVLVDGVSVPVEKPLDGFGLQRVTGTCEQGISLANIRNAELRDISVTGITGPTLATSNVTGTGLAGAVPYTPRGPH